MASFDVIEAAGQGYRQVWEERAYLARLALVPVLVKFVCTLLILTMDLETDYIRQALVSLPYFFTEGWMLAHVVRLTFLGQRWPFRPSGDAETDETVLRERFRGVMGGTLVYVIIRFAMAGIFAAFYSFEMHVGAQAGNVNPALLVLVLAMLAGMVWSFRLVWLFIPAALNYRIAHFMRALGGFGTSFYMIGAWLICLVPLLFVFQLAATAVITLAGGMKPPFDFIITLGQVIVDTVTGMIAAVGMGWGIRQIMLPDGDRPGAGNNRGR